MARDRITYPSGELDEVCVSGVSFFHLERMDDGHIWIGISDNDGHCIHINLATRRGAYIVGRVEDEGDTPWPGIEHRGEPSAEPWKR